MMFIKTAAILIAAIAVPAVAAPADEASDRVLASFAACRALPDPVQRGLCYDRAYDAIQARLASGDVVISDAAHRQAGFGLRSEPVKRSASSKAGSPVPIAVNEIDSTIVVTRPYGVDIFAFQLADGSVWRTADGGPDPLLPRGTKVHVKKASLGGFLLKPEHGRPFRVVRVR